MSAADVRALIERMTVELASARKVVPSASVTLFLGIVERDVFVMLVEAGGTVQITQGVARGSVIESVRLVRDGVYIEGQLPGRPRTAADLERMLDAGVA